MCGSRSALQEESCETGHLHSAGALEPSGEAAPSWRGPRPRIAAHGSRSRRKRVCIFPYSRQRLRESARNAAGLTARQVALCQWFSHDCRSLLPGTRLDNDAQKATFSSGRLRFALVSLLPHKWTQAFDDETNDSVVSCPVAKQKRGLSSADGGIAAASGA